MNLERLLLALVGFGLVVAAVLVAGGYNVSAAAGHFRPVSALLHFTMQNSVLLRARGPVPDDLHTDARALAGAGHYDLVCRDCHGAPGVPLTAVARSLEPPPPHIVEAVRSWDPDELFWIVKQGIKMTAMPAWPSQHRDDEVWSVVAFLLRLPEMEEDVYRSVVAGAEAPNASSPGSGFEAALARCARCHGLDGRGLDAVGFPRLDRLSRLYIENTLHAFAEGRRASGIMQVQASVAPRRYFAALADHYAQAAPRGTGVPEDHVTRGASAAGSRGERIALEGVPERRVPACAACHGPARYPLAEAYPSLAGQRADYLEAQLRLFRSGHRGGSAFSGIMEVAAHALEDHDLTAVARYYASLRGGSTDGTER